MDINEIKNNLGLNEVENLLSYFGAEPHRQNNIIISRTICHCGNSHKLFYYDNTKLFRCYTDCGDTFDIGELVIKVYHNEGKDIGLPQAVAFLKQFFNLIDNKSQDFFGEENELKDWQVLNKYIENSEEMNSKQIVELKKYDDTILKFLPKPRIIPWEKEGITVSAIEHHNICYNPSSQAIVIPHYDEDSNLIGIRERTLIKENEQYGKYRPMYLNRKMYNHPLGFSLYNLNNSKENIKKLGKAIVFESEKSCLLYESYFGNQNDISVAVCGSNLSKYQVNLLLQYGAKEIVIAFDKQYQYIGDNEYKGWVKKLLTISNKYSSLCNISFIFDTTDVLGYKDAPIDLGPEKFLYLFKNRLDKNGNKK